MSVINSWIMKVMWRKLFLISYWPILILFGILTLSCSNDEISEDEYYVKYEIQSESIYITTRYAEINLEDNTSSTFTFKSDAWETTIGPVKKGFNAKLIGGYNSQSITNSYIDAKIHISKNNGPFALKKFDASSSPRTLVEINYTIDF